MNILRSAVRPYEETFKMYAKNQDSILLQSVISLANLLIAVCNIACMTQTEKSILQLLLIDFVLNLYSNYSRQFCNCFPFIVLINSNFALLRCISKNKQCTSRAFATSAGQQSPERGIVQKVYIFFPPTIPINCKAMLYNLRPGASNIAI